MCLMCDVRLDLLLRLCPFDTRARHAFALSSDVMMGRKTRARVFNNSVDARGGSRRQHTA
ncbi:hypothetical protein BZM27_49580 [Paraburkholderia steynii]|uniref:Uncharacterized protein n=1 Tax=Paraburkholderia steynii TaxID=1245441 RepID=A0A4R0X9E1_9BURK|nr:hypothetical protein BZM27_49580 [Paraburkholderia steynii]